MCAVCTLPPMCLARRIQSRYNCMSTHSTSAQSSVPNIRSRTRRRRPWSARTCTDVRVTLLAGADIFLSRSRVDNQKMARNHRCQLKKKSERLRRNHTILYSSDNR
jgi:hypothetical protein